MWGTYYGGSYDEGGQGMGVDAHGNVYVGGYTGSASGIATSGAHQTAYGGSNDAFLAKFDYYGNLVWGTYFGTSSYDVGYYASTDTAGNTAITGVTQSSSGLATSGSYQTSNGGGDDAYIAYFNKNGKLIYSSYIGGSGNEFGNAVTVDNAGNAYATGKTPSTTKIATSGAYQTSNKGGGGDAYLVKLDKDRQAHLGKLTTAAVMRIMVWELTLTPWEMYIFQAQPRANQGLLPQGAYKSSNSGDGDAFLAKFNATTGALGYGTYFGGSGL